MRKQFLLPFIALAAAGFVLSALFHGYILSGRSFQPEFFMRGLLFGVLLLWAPSILLSRAVKDGSLSKPFSKTFLGNPPGWMKYSYYGIGIYGFINFFLSQDTPLSFFKYGPAHSGSLNMARFLSGIALTCYSGALITLYSAYRLDPWTPSMKCANGHRVPLGNPICPGCGMMMNQPPPLPPA